MTRHVLNSVISVELDFNMRLKQRRKDRLDVEMPTTTLNEATRPVVKDVVNGQTGVKYVVNAVATRQ